MVRYVAESVARIKEMSLEQLAEQTRENAMRLFNIKNKDETRPNEIISDCH